MKKAVALVLSVSLLAMLLSGCRGSEKRAEADMQFLVAAMGFDSENGKISVSAETIIVNSENTKESMNTKVFSGSGKTVYQAISDIGKQLVKPLLLSHCGMLALGDSLSQKQLAEVMSYCFKEKDITLAAIMISTKNAAELLSCERISSLAVGYDIMGVIKQKTDESGILYNNRYYEVQANRLKKRNVFSMPYFSVSDREYRMDGVRVFCEDRPVLLLDDRQSFIYAVLCNSYGRGTVNLGALHKKVYSAVPISKYKLNGDKLSVTIDVSMNVEDKNQAFIDLFVQEAEQLVRLSTEGAETDIFGLGNTIYRKDEKLWNRVKSQYTNTFRNATVKIKCTNRQ